MRTYKTIPTRHSSGIGVTIGIREIMDIVGGIVFLVSLFEVFGSLFKIPIDPPIKYVGAVIGIGVGYFLAWKRQRGR